MNHFSLRHLNWVLWIWLLLQVSKGEDGLAKSEKRLVIKQESSPRGDSLVRSFVSTRVSRAFTSSSSFDDDVSAENNKSPGDRKSTIRIRNDTVDLSKNTVPVVKYPSPTEPSLKEKYKRTAAPSGTTPFKKPFKLKRNMTRPRPMDLTTLLAFNALTPSPSGNSQQSRLTHMRPVREGYPSSTQVAESMPPTAWALASLKGPNESTRKPGPANVKPFVSWSTRLNKPTTPSPSTEATELATGPIGSTVETNITETDITGEGVDMTVTTSPNINISVSTDPLPAETKTISGPEPSNIPVNTMKPQDITSDKPEENTISAPSLLSLKNSTTDEMEDKKSLSASFQYFNPTLSSTSESSLPLFISYASNYDNINSATDSRFDNSSLINPRNDQINDHFSAGQLLDNNTQVTTTEHQVTESIHLNISSSAKLNSSENIHISEGNTTDMSVTIDTTPFLNTSLPNIPQNNSISLDEEKQKEITNSEAKESQLDITTLLPSYELTRVHETPSSQVSEENKITIKRLENIFNKTIQEVDPSINTINEKKTDNVLSTSTIVSTVNSTTSVHVEPVVTTPGNINLTNLVDDELKHVGNEYELVKSLALTSGTTTTSTTPNINSVTQTSDLDKSHSSENSSLDTVINQTSNDIKPVNDDKPISAVLESNTEPSSSTRSNEIKPDYSKTPSNSTDYESELTIKQPEDTPGTTQSNYIQVNESIKPHNKTLIPEYSVHTNITEKPMETKTSPSTTTELPEMFTTLIPVFNLSEPTVIPNLPSENSAQDNTSSAVTIIVVPTTPPPVTTTPSPTTTVIPTIINTYPSSFPNITTSPSTNKSNDIKEQETNTPTTQSNIPNFQYVPPMTVKNESTPLVIHDPDDIEEDDSIYNHTDAINNGDTEDDNEYNFPEVIANSTAKGNKHNVSTNIPVILPPTSTTTTVKSPSSTQSTDEIIPTQIDEDQPSIDEDTAYDTGVIMTVYTQIIFDASYNEMCREKEQLKDAVVKIFQKYSDRTIDKNQVVITNLGTQVCSSLRGEMDQHQTQVKLVITDLQGQYDKKLNDLFVSLAKHNHLEFKYPFTIVDDMARDTDSQTSGTVVAAIIISSIAGVCLLALTILLVIMRKRQTGFNYGERCTPVSLDDYSLDNISVYNSVRRKAMRASKRSYGNPAFDDPDVISNPVNFAGLANMASDRSKTDEEFSMLPVVTVKHDELPPRAESKNRYANVIPLPETRVQLKRSSPDEQFINANYVKGVKGADKFYIACQAPMQNTIEDFWQMIWDEQCRLIIMLTALTENGVEKCADYLPPSEVLDCHRVFGDLQVTLKKREAREKYVISSLQLKNLETNLWREVTHMWYAGWPPTGVPPEPSSVIAFLIEARSFSKSSPIVVHCSPGTGRTGTVIAIDTAIRDFEAGRSVDIPKTVLEVRRGRSGAVQTKDQYHFIYKVLHLYATKLTGGGLDSI